MKVGHGDEEEDDEDDEDDEEEGDGISCCNFILSPMPAPLLYTEIEYG